MVTVEVRSRVVGRLPSEDTPANVVLNLLHETLTTGELIASTVEEQLRDLMILRKLDAEKAQQILNRQYLTEDEIRQQEKRGFIRLASVKETRVEDISIEAEIAKAQRAFEQKTYLIVVDGCQPETLDDEITLTSTSKVTFIKMIPLAGG
jgi:hypothetical protein